MEEFYPSEIARLVLGYLSEMKWEKSWKTFLEECSDLQEYFNLYKKGKIYATKVNGNSLSDILTEYCVLKSEALRKGTYQEQSSRSLNVQEGISAEAVEKIVKNALDVAFEKYLPSACKSRLNDYVSECRTDDPGLDCRLNDPVLDDRANDSGDSVTFIQRKTKKKDKLFQENMNDRNRTESASHPNVQLNAPEAIATPTLQPNITSVMSVSNRDYNSMQPSEKELTTSSLLALQTVARMSFQRNGLNEISNDSVLNSSNKKSRDSSSRNKSEKVPIVIKIEDEDLFTSHITAQKESNNHTEKASVQRKGCVSRDSGIEGESHSSETASGELEKNLPGSVENNSLEAKNAERDSLKLNSDRDVLNSKPEDNLDKQGSSTPSLNCSNLSFQQVPPLNMQNSVVNTLSSANNLAGFSISSSSISNQLTALSDLSLSSVPTYFLSNFPSSGQIVQNSTPYQFVIKSPVNGMSLTVPSVNSVSNTVFTLPEPRKDNGTSSQLVPISCSSLPTTTTLSGSKNSDRVVKGLESVKRKNKNEALPECKKSNSSEDASKRSTDSPPKKKLPSSKLSSKPKSYRGKKQKPRLTRSHRKKLISESSDLSKEKAATSTEENDLPDTDCDNAQESSNETMFDLF